MKSTRTQIQDLPEISAELSEREMRIVTGGLLAVMACSALAFAPIAMVDRTSYITGRGDHDSD